MRRVPALSLLLAFAAAIGLSSCSEPEPDASPSLAYEANWPALKQLALTMSPEATLPNARPAVQPGAGPPVELAAGLSTGWSSAARALSRVEHDRSKRTTELETNLNRTVSSSLLDSFAQEFLDQLSPEQVGFALVEELASWVIDSFGGKKLKRLMDAAQTAGDIVEAVEIAFDVAEDVRASLRAQDCAFRELRELEFRGNDHLDSSQVRTWFAKAVEATYPKSPSSSVALGSLVPSRVPADHLSDLNDMRMGLRTLEQRLRQAELESRERQPSDEPIEEFERYALRWLEENCMRLVIAVGNAIQNWSDPGDCGIASTLEIDGRSLARWDGLPPYAHALELRNVGGEELTRVVVRVTWTLAADGGDEWTLDHSWVPLAADAWYPGESLWVRLADPRPVVKVEVDLASSAGRQRLASVLVEESLEWTRLARREAEILSDCAGAEGADATRVAQDMNRLRELAGLEPGSRALLDLATARDHADALRQVCSDGLGQRVADAERFLSASDLHDCPRSMVRSALETAGRAHRERAKYVADVRSQRPQTPPRDLTDLIAAHERLWSRFAGIRSHGCDSDRELFLEEDARLVDWLPRVELPSALDTDPLELVARLDSWLSHHESEPLREGSEAVLASLVAELTEAGSRTAGYDDVLLAHLRTVGQLLAPGRWKHLSVSTAQASALVAHVDALLGKPEEPVDSVQRIVVHDRFLDRIEATWLRAALADTRSLGRHAQVIADCARDANRPRSKLERLGEVHAAGLASELRVVQGAVHGATNRLRESVASDLDASKRKDLWTGVSALDAVAGDQTQPGFLDLPGQPLASWHTELHERLGQRHDALFETELNALTVSLGKGPEAKLKRFRDEYGRDSAQHHEAQRMLARMMRTDATGRSSCSDRSYGDDPLNYDITALVTASEALKASDAHFRKREPEPGSTQAEVHRAILIDIGLTKVDLVRAYCKRATQPGMDAHRMRAWAEQASKDAAAALGRASELQADTESLAELKRELQAASRGC
jgi:hypothetical protein